MQGANPKAYSHLTEQTIDEQGPGTILRDFETLLAFIGEEGVPSAGKYHLLPMARLAEFNACMTRPLRPKLQRPQQRSFPHINGLYLLLRASQIGIAQGTGKSTGRLALDPAIHVQWKALNPTEQYFNLLEAWMRHGCWEMVGMRGGGLMSNLASSTFEAWNAVPAEGLRCERADARIPYFFRYVESLTTLALLELFGLMTIHSGEPDQGESWRIEQIHHTLFGDDLLALLFGDLRWPLFDLQKDGAPRPYFGAWQSLFQPYFPQWRDNLTLPEPEFRDGVYYFRASLGRVWRRIASPATCDLDDLALAIVRAFEFGGDHLYNFQLVGRDGRRFRVECSYCDGAEILTDEMTIGELPLSERESMTFQYDYGADWRFDVKLEKVDAPKAKWNKPKVVASHGEAPPEYPPEDEYDGW